MLPDPNIVLREKPLRTRREREKSETGSSGGLAGTIISAIVVILLAATFPWSRRWLKSGTPILSILIIHGSATCNPGFRSLPLWTTLAFLNLVYAVASTSPVLYKTFSFFCYPCVLVACILVSPSASQSTGRRISSLLARSRIIKDRFVFGDLPGLQIDAGISGLVVVRGITLCLSKLTAEAHGLEIGLKLTDGVELAFYTDEIVVHLFRGIRIEEVFVIFKEARSKESFDPSEEVEDHGTKTEKSGGDLKQNILSTSPVQQSREQVENSPQSKESGSKSRREVRAAICAKLQDFPSVPHAPSRPVKVTTIVDLFPAWMRYILHRTPLLLRVMLRLCSLHKVSIESMSAAGSGQRLAVLRESVTKHQTNSQDDLKRLEDEVDVWLMDANFCLEFFDIDAFGQVPVRTALDIVTYARCADVIAYRTVPDSGAIETSAELGGLDVTFAIPLCLLPDHEHLIPAPPSEEERQQQKDELEQVEGQPRKAQAQSELEKLEADQSIIAYSVHGRLPFHMDQSLLDFLAATGKEWVKMLQLEKDDGGQNDDDNDDSQQSAESPSSHSPPQNEDEGGRKRDKLLARAKGLPSGLKNSVKNAAVGRMVNDQWIARMVGHLSAQLQRTKGDFGYVGEIPISLQDYRGSADLPSKILS